jgi:serine/threonine protein kinase
MEYALKGDLDSYLATIGIPTEAEAIDIFDQILNGIAYLHSRNVVHRDLKPQNILRDSYGGIRVADFGMAKVFEKGKSVTNIGGTESYAPPEYFDSVKYDGAKFDVWSLGVIFYQLLTSTLPFSGISAILQVKYVVPTYIPVVYGDIIRNILVRDPSHRPSADEVRSDVLSVSLLQDLFLSPTNTQSDQSSTSNRGLKPVRGRKQTGRPKRISSLATESSGYGSSSRQ